jgi:hypothetical protein
VRKTLTGLQDITRHSGMPHWLGSDNPNITKTLEYTKDKHNAKIKKIKSLS